jgi:hypothetical protein
VRLVERVDEAVVVASFLRAELTSERFGAGVRAAVGDEELITDADLLDLDANAARRRALEAHRGEYLGDLFDRVSAWWHVELAPEEVLEIRYIAWDYWLELTGGTRLPRDGAARWLAEGSDDRYRPGAEPLIVVRAGPADHLCIVEGHVRLTVLAMSPDAIPERLSVLLGEGDAVRGWTSYGAG